MFENPRRGGQARNLQQMFRKIRDLKVIFRTDIFQKLTLDTPDQDHEISSLV